MFLQRIHVYARTALLELMTVRVYIFDKKIIKFDRKMVMLYFYRQYVSPGVSLTHYSSYLAMFTRAYPG